MEPRDWRPSRAPEVETICRANCSAAAAESIDLKIQSCGDFIRKLKQEKASKEAIGTEVKVLLLLKELYKKKTGQEWKPAAGAPEAPKVEKKKEEAKPAAEKDDG